jgi:hypothetical protein
MKTLLAQFLVLLAVIATARAQLDVSIEMKRNIFMRGEPVEVSVLIRNLAGKDVILRDVESHQWFGFELTHGSENPIGPRDAGYKNEPVVILNGDTVRRKVDLLRLYPITEFGTYKMRAAIYFAETGKYIASETVRVDISDGRRMWSQTVGVPASRDGAGQYRKLSLLSFQQPKELTAYVRVEDERTGDILGTYPLGRLVGGATPTTEFDADNTLHVFHLVGPHQYALSKIGVNGEWLGQTMWSSSKGRATVRRKEDGRMVIVGATRADLPPPSPLPVPKLSDRPVAVPK